MQWAVSDFVASSFMENSIRLKRFKRNILSGPCVRSLFCCVVLCVLSSFAIISFRKRELVTLLY